MSAAGGAGADARKPKTAFLPVPILRTTSLYNKNQHPIEDFDIKKLQYATPATADQFYKDGVGNIVVPLVYDGTFAMNHGFILSHGKFDLVESAPARGERSFQLMATYPVHRVDEELSSATSSDARKQCMLLLLRAIHAVEQTAKKWIVADTTGRLFNATYGEADLAPKSSVDGKSKFSSQIYAGTTKGGDAALLKTYFKLPHSTADDGTIRLYCDLVVNGVQVESLLPSFVEHVNWKNNVGIVFSFKDLYKSAYGISLRTRIDIVGAWMPPKVTMTIKNPFLVAGDAIKEDD